MAIDYASLPGNPTAIYQWFPQGLPADWSWEEYYAAHQSDYNPDAYTNDGDRYRAWIASGRPGKDAMGRPLNNNGTTSYEELFFTPPAVENSPDDFLTRFASTRPWAQDYIRRGGRSALLQQIGFISQQDFNNYSAADQQLIQNILGQHGMTPAWMSGGGTNPVGRPTAGGPPDLSGQPPTDGTNPIGRPLGDPSLDPTGAGNPVGRPNTNRQYPNQVVPDAKTFTPQAGTPSLSTLGQQSPVSATLGNTSGRRRPGLGSFARRTPGGYQGY